MLDLSQFEGHTPGPWHSDDRFGKAYIYPQAHIGRGVGFAVDPKADREDYVQQIACAMPDRHKRSDYRANARLIAAAPDLLEAYSAALIAMASARGLISALTGPDDQIAVSVLGLLNKHLENVNA